MTAPLTDSATGVDGVEPAPSEHGELETALRTARDLLDVPGDRFAVALPQALGGVAIFERPRSEPLRF